MTPAKDIILRVGDILQDEDHVRWEVPEVLRWINDAARETILRRPAAGAVIDVLTLAAGTRQVLDDRATELLDVVRNMAEDGITPGRVIRRVDRQLLDDQYPDWHTARQRSEIKHYTFDERAPSVFYVFPAAIAGTKVEALYAELPAEVLNDTQSLDMSPEYVNALTSYVCFRALSKDSEYANGQVAALHYQSFVEAVTDNNAKTTAFSPNQNSV
jgi:hypothetical protein